MLASTILMLLASAVPSLAQDVSIQTFAATNPPVTSGSPTLISSAGNPVVSSCIGDGCGTSTTSACYAVCVREPCYACSTAHVPGLPSLSDTGAIFSIPANETGSPTPAPSSSTSGGGAASSSATAAQSTGAAPCATITGKVA